MYSVIVPTYNRKDNLQYCLRAISKQVDPPPFEVIVVDDGSTDGTRDWLLETYPGVRTNNKNGSAHTWFRNERNGDNIDLTYMSGGPNKGFRGGRARNLAAFNAAGDRFIFIDSDVVINQHVLHEYDRAAQAQPQAVIVGRYDWLPPLALDAQNEHWLYESTDLGEIVTKVLVNGRDNDSPFGIDQRAKDYTDDLNKIGKGAALGALSGNISYPRELFLRVGGFDEAIVGHGGEDADLGLTVDQEAQADWLFYAPLIGFHLWHPRNQRRNMKEVQANIQYIDFKHGVGAYKDAKKWSDARDWTEPGHYHKHFGSKAIKTENDPTVWVEREEHRMGISSQMWLERLGFSFDDVQIVSQEKLDSFKIEGSTPPPGLEHARVEATA